MLANDHAGIDRFLHTDEEVAAIFQFPHRIGHRNPGLHRDQNPGAAAFDGALVRGPVVEHPVQNTGATRIGHELAMIANQAARWHIGDDPGLARTGRFHFHKLAPARAGQLFNHGTGEFIIHVDGDFFDGLVPDAVDIAEQHARAADRQFEPLAAHVFNQHAHLQFAPARHFKGVAAGCVGDLDGHVDFGFLHQAFADHAGLDLGAILARKRRVVDAEGDGNRRRINRLRGQRNIHVQRTQRIGHGGLGHAGNRHDITGNRLIDRRAGKAPEGQDLGHAELLDPLAGARQRLQRFTDRQRSSLDPSGQDAADERVCRQRGGQHPERLCRLRDLPGGGDVAHDQVEQRVQVLARAVQLLVRPSGTARGVKMRKVQLRIIGAQVGEQIEHLVQGAVRFRIRLVDLVQHDNRAQAQGQRLGGYEFCLRHRAFGGIDQQHDTVDHAQDPLHLAAEIGVAGGIHDIDAHAIMFNAGTFGQNGDAAFTFDVVAVHRAFGGGLIVAVGAGLFEKLVNERCLAMVDVRDNGDVAKLHRRGLFPVSALARA